MNLNLPTHRGRFGFSGLGACNPPVGGSPWCLNPATGSLVDCNSDQCKTPFSAAGAGATWSTGSVPAFNAPQVFENIPIGGFTGTFAVPTLESWLGDRLAAKESPFIANTIARGADTVDNQANDFYAQADDHCGTYPNSAGCENKNALAAKYAAMFRAWAAGQQASVYQSGDSGTLAAPVNVLTGSAPVYHPVTQAPAQNVLTAPPQNNNTSNANLTNGANTMTPGTDLNKGNSADPGDTAQWLKDNALYIGLGVAALVLLPQLMKS